MSDANFSMQYKLLTDRENKLLKYFKETKKALILLKEFI